MIGNETVHTECEKPRHILGLVDGPDVNGDLSVVGELDQLGSDKRVATERLGNLQGHHALGSGFSLHRGLHDRQNVASRGTDGDLAAAFAQLFSQLQHDRILARSEQGQVAALILLNQFDHPPHQVLRVGFDFEIETSVWKRLEGFFESRHANTLPPLGKGLSLVHAEVVRGVQFSEFVEGEIFDGSGAVGGAIDIGIVNQDRHAIARDVQVAFENFGTQGKALGECDQRVLRRAAGSPPMADDDRVQYLKVGVWHGG